MRANVCVCACVWVISNVETAKFVREHLTQRENSRPLHGSSKESMVSEKAPREREEVVHIMMMERRWQKNKLVLLNQRHHLFCLLTFHSFPLSRGSSSPPYPPSSSSYTERNATLKKTRPKIRKELPNAFALFGLWIRNKEKGKKKRKLSRGNLHPRKHSIGSSSSATPPRLSSSHCFKQKREGQQASHPQLQARTCQ